MFTRKICTVCAYLIILGGSIHIALAPVFFHEFSMRVSWFVGQGLAGIFLGILNLIVLRSKNIDRFTYWATNIANILMAIFVVLALQVDKAPQGFVLGGVIVLLTVCAWKGNRSFMFSPEK